MPCQEDFCTLPKAGYEVPQFIYLIFPKKWQKEKVFIFKSDVNNKQQEGILDEWQQISSASG